MSLLARMAWRNLWRNPQRSLLSLAAIAFGVTLLVFSVGLQIGGYEQMIGNTVRLLTGLAQVQRPGYLDAPRLRLDIPAARDLRARLEAGLRELAPGVVVAPRAQSFVLLSSERRSLGALLVGVDPRAEARLSSLPGTVHRGRYLRTGEEVVLGAALARNLGLAPGDEVTVLGSARDGSVVATVLTVVGVFESGARELDRSLAQMPLATFQDLFAMPDRVHALVLGEAPLDALPELVRRTRALLPPDPPLAVLTWEHIEPGVKQAIEMDFASGWLMYLILVLVITFSILNTFLMAVLERRREFGVLLALGFRHGRLLRLVLWEAALLTALGVLLGMALGAALVAYFAVHGITFEGMEVYAEQFNLPPYLTPKLTPFVLFSGPAVVLAVTLLAALYPASRVRAVDPAETTREAG